MATRFFNIAYRRIPNEKPHKVCSSMANQPLNIPYAVNLTFKNVIAVRRSRRFCTSILGQNLIDKNFIFIFCIENYAMYSRITSLWTSGQFAVCNALFRLFPFYPSDHFDFVYTMATHLIERQKNDLLSLWLPKLIALHRTRIRRLFCAWNSIRMAWLDILINIYRRLN